MMISRTLPGHFHIVTIMAALTGTAWAAAPESVEPPPNAPATVEWDAGQRRLSLRYHGSVILDAAVRAEDARGREAAGVGVKLEPAETRGDKVEQRLKFLPAKPREGAKLVLNATVTGSEEAFPAETNGEAQRRFPLVRTSVGLSHSLRNNAVYDRRWDWVLVGPGDGATHIVPKAVDKQRIAFSWESRGAVLELVFRPRFYQKHRELANFEPWTYQVWKGPITGYCTWWAYRDGINQQTLDALVDVFAEKRLPEFGYKYIQLDAGYCGGGGGPQSFLEWDKRKFPGGAEYAVKKIKSAGMEGGIWVHRVYRSYVDRYLPQIGKQHPDWFVTKADGSIFQGSYGVWCLNTRNSAALEALVRPLFRGLRQVGWVYVKIDGAGDCLYSLRQAPWFFAAGGSTPEQSLRDWDRVAREELGRDVFILTCWGVGPGRCSIGLVDGCRLGSDGFQWRTLVQNNSLNGVVWRGDPDHCDIMAEGAKDKTTMKTFGTPAAMADTIDQPSVVAMAGSVLMVSDKAEDYKDDSNLEGMKRSAPVLFTVPGQLYDGGGNGTWWLQEIDRPFEHWSVLARFNWRQEKLKWKRPDAPEQEVKLADLGLADDLEYLVFEFWTQTFIGKSKGSFKAPALGSNSAMQVFAIREARPHPWVLSTTRHISQGGVSLLDERWDAGRKVLAGKSAVVVGDPYVLTVQLPEGFRLRSAEVGGEKAEIANQQETATVRFVPAATKTLEWSMAFAANPAGGAGPAGAAPDWQMGPFVRLPQPVLSPTPDSKFQCPVLGKEVQWEEQNVYNPAAVVRDGRVYLLYRADDKNPALKWGRTCRIGLAHSDDGIHFTRHPTPVLFPDNDEWKQYEWEGGCEDLHIVEGEDGVYYMNYTTWSGKGDTMSVATSRDLVRWTKHGPAFRKAAPDKVPGSRSGVVVSRREGDRLIAAKINGKYWMYYTHPCAIGWSENLIDWTPTGKAVWGGSREAGAIALLREDGILLMTQGAHHSLGAWTLRQALIDRNDLRTVLKEPKEPFLYPEYDWEKKGFTGHTTVANGLVPFKG